MKIEVENLVTQSLYVPLALLCHQSLYPQNGALLLCPCLFRPSDNLWRSRRADASRCTHFSTVISPSCITEQISVGKCANRGESAHRECQTSFKIVTWTKQTWTKHHNTEPLCTSFKMNCYSIKVVVPCACSEIF